MKRIACITLISPMLLLTSPLTGLADTYRPYPPYVEYDKNGASEAPSVPPAPPQPGPDKAKPPLRPEQPITLTQPPEFLFPSELEFGVAVGVPYDLFYLSGSYYFLKNGVWYRSSSYKGPWTVQGLSRVPAELRKPSLKKIRDARNREFAIFWKNRERYQGKYFQPQEEPRAPRLQGH